MPALRATAGVVGRNGLFFAALGGTFAAAENIASSIRSKDDVWNGIYGGLAAGAVVGVKALSPTRGAAAGLAFAAVAAAVDMSGQSLTASRFSDTKKTFNYGHGVTKE